MDRRDATRPCGRSGSAWSGAELAERLGVTTGTVRNDTVHRADRGGWPPGSRPPPDSHGTLSGTSGGRRRERTWRKRRT
ncbi:MAG TPA: HTH domain-containing protein [Actinomycetes bacterium]|nr:HTH domain-containing protein [Actinomycetes bacterium]HXQ58418.1 HTH domain-containing protein [Actinomycetes bacterium]